MRKQFSTLVFTVALMLAITFTFSCSGNPDDDGGGNDPSGGGGNMIDGGTFTDSRDNRSYKWVKIGSQTWMAENLRYSSNGSCNNYCPTYGQYYSWTVAMNIEYEYGWNDWIGGDVKHQGICPSGWHLPSYAEVITLTNFVGPSTAGTKLKARNGWKYDGNGTDDFGFSALPGGYLMGGGDQEIGSQGCWWTATANPSTATTNATYAFFWNVSSQYSDFGMQEFSKAAQYPVRCVKD